MYLGKWLWSVASLYKLYIITFYSYCSFFFACSRLQSQVQGKPYKPRREEEQGLTEYLQESTQAMQNEASSVRGKREVIYNLTDVWGPPSYCLPPKSSYSYFYVKGRCFCYSYVQLRRSATPPCCYNSMQICKLYSSFRFCDWFR